MTAFAITSINFPDAFKALDAEIAQYWACPDSAWQENFLLAWATKYNDPRLLAALGEDVGDAHVFAYLKWLDASTPSWIGLDNAPEWGPWRELADACILNRFA